MFRLINTLMLALGLSSCGFTTGYAPGGPAATGTYSCTPGWQGGNNLTCGFSYGSMVYRTAGSGLNGTNDGLSNGARFNNPIGLTSDGTYVYVADFGNHSIRLIDPGGNTVTTLAGLSGTSGSTDALGTSARFNFPYGITNAGSYLYVADYGNHTIRKVNKSTGLTQLLAGAPTLSGSSDGTGATARFNGPMDLTHDGTYLYVVDGGNSTIRKVDMSSGVTTTLAGLAMSTGTADGIGNAARFSGPSAITIAGSNLFVADNGNDLIRQVNISSAEVTTLAGIAGANASVDGTGTTASFQDTAGITTDGVNLYVTDKASQVIRKIDIATAVVTTIAGDGTIGSTDGTSSGASFDYPHGMCFDGTQIYVSDSLGDIIRMLQ